MIAKKLTDIKLSKKDRQGIEAAVKLLKEQFPVEEVILFGSKARGTDDPESDIDLLILTSYSLSWQERDQLVSALFKIELEHDVVISTLIVPNNEWKYGYWTVLPIRDEIDRDGVAA